MRPDLGPPPKPPVPLARTEKLAAGLLELLAALLSHDAIRDDACRVGGDVEAARGLLPSGKHRPTWTTTIAHQARSIHWSPYDPVGVVNADP